MLHDRERAAIDGLWTVKISQDARDLPQAQRCRNLEPDRPSSSARSPPAAAPPRSSRSAAPAASRRSRWPRRRGGPAAAWSRSRSSRPDRRSRPRWPISASPTASTTCWPMPASPRSLRRSAVRPDRLREGRLRPLLRRLRLAPAPSSSPTTSCRTTSRNTSATSAPARRPVGHAANRQGPGSQPIAGGGLPPLTRPNAPRGLRSLYTVAPMFVTRTRSADPA